LLLFYTEYKVTAFLGNKKMVGSKKVSTDTEKQTIAIQALLGFIDDF
jgi:hypothetical protein